MATIVRTRGEGDERRAARLLLIRRGRGRDAARASRVGRLGRLWFGTSFVVIVSRRSKHRARRQRHQSAHARRAITRRSRRDPTQRRTVSASGSSRARARRPSLARAASTRGNEFYAPRGGSWSARSRRTSCASSACMTRRAEIHRIDTKTKRTRAIAISSASRRWPNPRIFYRNAARIAMSSRTVYIHSRDVTTERARRDARRARRRRGTLRRARSTSDPSSARGVLRTRAKPRASSAAGVEEHRNTPLVRVENTHAWTICGHGARERGRRARER